MHRTHIGLQIPLFTYPDVPPAQLFERVAAQAVTAERSGFDTVFVMDHFYQLPMMGRPDQEMFGRTRCSGRSPRAPSGCASARSSRASPTATRRTSRRP